MISKEELVKGIARTQSDMDVALRDASLRNEVSAVEARYAALGLIEDFMRSAAGSRKLSAYRDSYHRDFILTVALDEQDKTPVSCTTRELASV